MVVEREMKRVRSIRSAFGQMSQLWREPIREFRSFDPSVSRYMLIFAVSSIFLVYNELFPIFTNKLGIDLMDLWRGTVWAEFDSVEGVAMGQASAHL